MQMQGKLNFSKTSVKTTIKQYVIMTLGVIVYSFTWVGIIMPADGVGGGATGAALLIFYATGGVAGGGVPVGVSFFAINATLIITAVIFLGAKFGMKTIYCIVLVSVIMSFMQQWMPENVFGLGDDKLLSAILGGVVAGMGIAMVLTQGGSTGGTDIVAMIINKYRNISYGKVLVAIDFIIIGCSYFIFRDIATIIYGYVLVAVVGYTADMLLAGSKQSAQIMIMSLKYPEIADMVTTQLNRGATLIDGTGWYTKKEAKILLVVCRKSEANILLQHVKNIDPDAFITMGSVMGVYGRGFEIFKK